MENDDALNALLDQLDAANDRHTKRDALRRWIAELRRAWQAESVEGREETLGKLGGGGQ